MSRLVIALSGPLAAGKTTLANALAERGTGAIVSVRDIILSNCGISGEERSKLQAAGLWLDESTAGAWLVDATDQKLAATSRPVIIDAVRTRLQLCALRGAFGLALAHLHLTASEEERARRYHRRSDPVDRPLSFVHATGLVTEEAAGDLIAEADHAIDTSAVSPDAVEREALDFLAGAPPV